MLPRAVKTPVVCLPDKKPKPRQLCSVMGWGKINPGDLYGIPVLREAKVWYRLIKIVMKLNNKIGYTSLELTVKPYNYPKNI